MSLPQRLPERARRLRALPSVERLAQTLDAETSLAGFTAAERRAAARQAIAQLRTELQNQALERSAADLFAQSLAAARAWLAARGGMRPVINATGVILHTNLGRAPLARAALEALTMIAGGYCNLEYDLATGRRDRRDRHGEAHWQMLLGCEAALVVNNCAAAVWLVLDTFGRGQTALISRGELVEIGGGFRIPDIMAKSGVTLCEVGTTNRTRLADYAAALETLSDARLIVRVHQSNFRLLGFTERPSLAALAVLARQRGLLLFDDIGSGQLTDLSAYGVLDEPSPARSLADGADLVTFSADKLLGGPQAGVIAGRRDLIEQLRRNPLLRALRADKLTYAALEATLKLYCTRAPEAIPTVAMIRQTPDAIRRRARRLRLQIQRRCPAETLAVHLSPGHSVIGGGCAPQVQLPTTLVRLTSTTVAADELATRLRQRSPAIVTRIENGCVVLDPRTILPAQERALLQGIVESLA
ncbi:MAG: L-seryl-tRNA(Sec) selenium transferase [Chloracidobacterium sp.]|uniref:L-seryl-tRNA(Sec) selenium transferase n=1 Tax=Chloracidobacterium validum TaxID=2821543 RepID=A0ABX8BB62_9BACT|nr:L-seryl-tRNA(Sec) selenium transferase [Chloracidobacterium validum]QUW02995.1 L-seryl-tRNA(Sec) selenium transferase [Chloracidobacterium validum]